MAGWPGSVRRRLVAGAVVAALTAAVTVATVTGTREPASALDLLSGDAWLANRVTGTVSHILGMRSGRTRRCR